MRWVMTRVLPVPAPARMRIDPLVASTASRCWGFKLSRISICQKVPADSGPGRMHFSRAQRSEQTGAQSLFRHAQLSTNARRSVRRRSQIDLEEEQRLGVVHKCQVGNI